MCRLLDLEKKNPGFGRYFLFDLKKSIQLLYINFPRETQGLKVVFIHYPREDSCFVIILLILYKLIVTIA